MLLVSFSGPSDKGFMLREGSGRGAPVTSIDGATIWKLLARPGSLILANSDCLGVSLDKLSFLPLVYIDSFLGSPWLVGVSVIGWLLFERMGVSVPTLEDDADDGVSAAEGVSNLNDDGESIADLNDAGVSMTEAVADLINAAAAEGDWVSFPGDPSTWKVLMLSLLDTD